MSIHRVLIINPIERSQYVAYVNLFILEPNAILIHFQPTTTSALLCLMKNHNMTYSLYLHSKTIKYVKVIINRHYFNCLSQITLCRPPALHMPSCEENFDKFPCLPKITKIDFRWKGLFAV